MSGQGRSLLTEAQWRSIGRRLGMSGREFQIVQRIFEGKTVAAIAPELGISAHTVRTHVERLYRKLGVGNRSQLLVRIFEAHLSLKSAAGPRISVAS